MLQIFTHRWRPISCIYIYIYKELQPFELVFQCTLNSFNRISREKNINVAQKELDFHLKGTRVILTDCDHFWEPWGWLNGLWIWTDPRSQFLAFLQSQTTSNTLYYKYCRHILSKTCVEPLFIQENTLLKVNHIIHNSIDSTTRSKHKNTKRSNTNKILCQVVFGVLKIKRGDQSSNL